MGKEAEKWHNVFAMLMPALALVALVARPVAAVAHRKFSVVRTVAPGVELIQEIIPAGEPDGPLVVTVIRVDPKVKGVRVEAALGGDTVWANDPTLGREIPSKTVARRKAVAGINASFFPFAGNPLGLHMEQGALITEPSLPRTAFLLLKDGTAAFGRFGYEGSVATTQGKTHLLNGLNRKPGQGNELLLFSPIFASQTLKIPERYEVVLEGARIPLTPNATVTGTVRPGTTGGATPLKPGTYVLSAGGTAAEWLKENVKPGESLTLKLAITPLDSLTTAAPDTIWQAVTGAPRIVTNGRLALKPAEEKVAESFSTTRHPRTAVGVTVNGKILFVTVDGRQPGLSRGVSLKELATLLLEYGAVDAVNLDGGGSSSCAIRDGVANSPSEGVERPVADSLLVFADEAIPLPGTPALSLKGPNRPLKLGETFTFPLPNAVEPTSVVWTTKGGIGFVSQEGVFHALRPGNGSVQLRRGKETVSIALRVAKGETKLDDAAFVPKASLSKDEKTLSFFIANSEGDRMGSESVLVEVVGGKPARTTVTTSSRGEGSVAVLWDSEAKIRQVKLSSPSKRFQSVTVKF